MLLATSLTFPKISPRFCRKTPKGFALLCGAATQEDELVSALRATLLPFGRQGADDTLQISCFRYHHHLCVRHGGVVHDADAIREAAGGGRGKGGLGARPIRLIAPYIRFTLLKWQFPPLQDDGSPRALSHCLLTANGPVWCLSNNIKHIIYNTFFNLNTVYVGNTRLQKLEASQQLRTDESYKQ